MKNSLKKYFEKLERLYLEKLNTKPTVPYFENCNLFISEPDEDDEAEWLPKEIEYIELNINKDLSNELYEFYTSYYYLHLAGMYKNIEFYFHNNMHSNDAINNIAKQEISDGQYYFKDEDCVLIGNAIKDGNDSLLVFYDNKSLNVFLYDQDFNKKIEGSFKLTEIIENLVPIF